MTAQEPRGSTAADLGRMDAAMGLTADPTRRSDRAYVLAYNAEAHDRRARLAAALPTELLNSAPKEATS